MLDHADHSVQASLQRFRILDSTERTIQNVVAAIGDEGLPVGPHPSRHADDKAPQSPCRRLPAERHDFDHNRVVDAETVNQWQLRLGRPRPSCDRDQLWSYLCSGVSTFVPMDR